MVKLRLRIPRLHVMLPSIASLRAFAVVSSAVLLFVSAFGLVTAGVGKIAYTLASNENFFISGSGFILAGGYIGAAGFLIFRFLAPEKE